VAEARRKFDDEGKTVQDAMERFFQHLPHWKRPSAVFEKAWKPVCDIYECTDHFSVVVDLAGVDEEKVEVMLHGRLLTIRGNRKQFRPASMSNTYMIEINYGDFERIIELPVDVDPDATRAIYRRGFLEIILPKVEGGGSRGVDISLE
jgi:HSP20 family protein